MSVRDSARRKITAARTALIIDQPFFGVLALRLKVVEDPSRPTAWTDGVHLGYNPEFIDGLRHDEVLAVVAHEVLHCTNGHPWRRDAREPRRWNYATDMVINPILRETGFTLPDDVLFETSPDQLGKSAEWIYARLPDTPPGGSSGGNASGAGGSGGDPSGQPGDSAGDPWPDPGEGTFGEVLDAPTTSEGQNAEAEWEQAVQQAAAAAKARGDLPSALDRLAEDAARPRADWRSALRRFVQEIARTDYSWTRPNPRYIASGLYLPSLRSEQMGPIAVAIDTSGSIDNVLLGQFESELRGIVEDVAPRRVHVIYCDAKVHRVDTFEREDPVELKAVGGGGTDFRPVFAHLPKLEEPPVALVYLTDLMGCFPEDEPGTPTLWATTTRREAPFGETVEVGA